MNKNSKPLIKNFGLFWHIENVDWGNTGHGRPGVLLGRTTKQPNVDFAHQIGIYALYDSNFSLVYVGQCNERNNGDGLKARLAEQRRDLPGRWDRFSWFGLKRVSKEKDKSGNYTLVEPNDSEHPDRQTILNHMEGILIFSAEPPLNGQKAKWKGHTTQYYQIRDPKLGATLDERFNIYMSTLEKK